MSIKHRAVRHVLFGAILLLLGSTTIRPAFGQRPISPKILPENTVAFVRVHDAQKLAENFRRTSTARLLQDEQVRPFVQHIYGSSIEAFQRIGDRLEVSLDELLAMPQGEICFAAVAPDEGRPALVVLIDVGEQAAMGRQLLENILNEMEQRGAIITTETINDVVLTVAEPTARRNRQLVFFDRDDTIGLVTDVQLAKQILSVWSGAEGKTLASNRDFAAVMKHCSGADGSSPDISYYVDPVRLIQIATSGNPGAQIALAMLDPLGLSGFRGVGGSLIYGDKEFEEISHVHVLLDNPREGVLEVLAFESGTVQPEPWVPDDIASYMSVLWDVSKTASAVESLYDTFRGEGAFEYDILEKVSDSLNVDARKELIGAVEDRVTMITWMQQPPRFNSQCTLFGVKLKDAAEFKLTFQRMLAKAGRGFDKKNYLDTEYYVLRMPNRGRNFDQQLMRVPEPSFTIIGDYLIYCDSSELIKQILLTKRGRKGALAESLDYRLIATNIARQARGGEPCMISFTRPDESLRTFYQFALEEGTQQKLAEMGKNNGLFRALANAMQDSPLPPFEVLAKYFAPSGGLMTNNETGLHLMGFTLRRD